MDWGVWAQYTVVRLGYLGPVYSSGSNVQELRIERSMNDTYKVFFMSVCSLPSCIDRLPFSKQEFYFMPSLGKKRCDGLCTVIATFSRELDSANRFCNIRISQRWDRLSTLFGLSVRSRFVVYLSRDTDNR